MIGLVSGLVPPLALVGLIVWLVTTRRHAGAGQARGAHAVREFMQYALLLVALFAAGTGVSRLVGAALPLSSIAGRRATEVALGVSLTVVALPGWIVLWRVVARRLAADVDERASAGWGLYLVVSIGVSLTVAYVQLVSVGRWLLGVEAYAPGHIGTAVVFAGIFASHTWLLGRPGLRPSAPWAVGVALVGSLVGLVGTATGVGSILATGLRELYQGVVGPPLVAASLRTALGTSVLVAAIGATTWWWHWWRQARTGERTVAWYVHVLLAGALGGLLAAVVAGGMSLHAVLQWWLGDPAVSVAAAHFDLLPSSLAATGVGLWLWAHHRGVLVTGSTGPPGEPVRAYAYLASAVGLVATAAGATSMIMAGIQVATPGAFTTADPLGRNTLVVGLTLLALGIPLWSVFWHRRRRELGLHGAIESGSASRRTYLVVFAGLGLLTSAISLVVVLYVLLRDALERQLTVTVLHELRMAIGLLVVAAVVGIHHAAVYRADRRLRPSEERPHPHDVLLVSSDGRELVRAVAAGTGARVHGLHRLDTSTSDVDVLAVCEAILASPHERVLVTIGGDEVEVIPYDPS